MSSDIVSMFHRSKCSSGFISHLYQHELRHLFSDGLVTVNHPVEYRLSPTSHLELPSGESPVTTRSMSFHTKLNDVLRFIESNKVNFVLCLKPSRVDGGNFDEQFIANQCRDLHLLESCHILSERSLHRIRLEDFLARYRFLYKKCAKYDPIRESEELLKRIQLVLPQSDISIQISSDTEYVNFSDEVKQMLERKRNLVRVSAARKIQTWWKQNRTRCDLSIILRTLSMNGLDEVDDNIQNTYVRIFHRIIPLPSPLNETTPSIMDKD